MKLSTIAALRAGVALTPVKKHPGHSDQKVHGRGRRGQAAKAAKFDGPEVKDWDDPKQVQARAEAIDSYNEKHGGEWASGERYDTEYLYRREDGSYTPQRAAMHDQIVDELMAKNADVPTDGQAVVLAGPPGAGKTSILKKSENGVAERVGVELNADGTFKSHAGENSDDIKGIMADKGMVPIVDGASAGEMVNLVHEESSHISKMYHNRLLSENKNVVIDGTLGGTNEQKQIDKIASTKKAGYEMRAIMVDTDPEMAIESASNRWVGGEKRGDKHGGRYVPPAVTEAESRPTGRVPGAKTANRENFEILTRPGSGVDFEETFVFDNSKTPQNPNGYGNVLTSNRVGGTEQLTGGTRLQQLGAPPVLSNLPGGTQGRPVTGGTFQGRDTGVTGPMFAKQESYKPTAGMIAEAKRGLEWRREFNRGGTAVGVARARDISNGKSLSLSTVKRMHSFFARHEVDKKGKGFNRGEAGYPSAGRIAWALWGGDAGFAWSRQISQREKNVNKAVSASVRDGLQRKVEEHNEKHGDAASKKVTLRMLSSVFERGVGAYKTNPQSVRPNVKSPDQWAYARVNTFLRAVRTGRFPGGKFDTDLLPSGHKMSTRKSLEEPMMVGKLANGDYVLVKHPGHQDQKSHGRKATYAGESRGVRRTGPAAVNESNSQGFKPTAQSRRIMNGEANSPATGKPISEEAQTAHRSYTQGNSANAINKKLRTRNENLSPEERSIQTGMDKAFNEASFELQQPRTVYRSETKRVGSASTGEAADLVVGNKIKQNDVSVDLGFMSTRGNAVDAAGDIESLGRQGFGQQVQVNYSIDVPAGTRMLAGNEGQGETIFDRGSQLRVTKVTKTGPNKVDVEAEVFGGTARGGDIPRNRRPTPEVVPGVRGTGPKANQSAYSLSPSERAGNPSPESRLGSYGEGFGKTEGDVGSAAPKVLTGSSDLANLESRVSILLWRRTGIVKHPGHSDQKSHGRKRRSGQSAGGQLTGEDIPASEGDVRGFTTANYPSQALGYSQQKKQMMKDAPPTEADKKRLAEENKYTERLGVPPQGMTDKEKLAKTHDSYIGSGHMTINGSLRDPEGPMTSASDEHWSRIEGKPNQQIDRLDQTFSQDNMGVELTRDAKLYRGVQVDRDIESHPMSKLEAGDEFTDLGFTSTSTNTAVTRDFIDRDARGESEGIQFNITAPAGTTVVGGMDAEQELILPRGSKFKVTGKTRLQGQDEDDPDTWMGTENGRPVFDEYNEGWSGGSKDILVVDVELIESKPVYKSVPLFKHPGHQDQKSHGRRAAGSGGGGEEKFSNGFDAMKESLEKAGVVDMALQSQRSEYVRGNRMNDQLRNPEKSGGNPPPGALDDMDRAFSVEQGMGVKTGPISVTRGAAFPQGDDRGKVFENVQTGDEFVDRGFVSTTLAGSGIEQNFMIADGTRVESFIKLQDGQTVIAGSEREQELILPRNSRFKVVEKVESTRMVPPSRALVGPYDPNKPETFTPVETKDIRLYLEVVDSPTVYKSISFFKHPGHADQKVHGRRSASRVQGYKKELAQRAYGEGGGTWDWRNESFVDDGKIVALEAYEGRYSPPAGGWTEESVADSIVDWSKSPDVQQGLRSRTDANVGMWLDEDSGDLFLDVSVKLTGASPEQASRLAKRENQLAWWDGDNQQLYVRNDAGNYVSETVD